MDSPFMTFFAEALAGRGLRVARFEFPYMAARRRDGCRRPPDPTPVLLAAWRAALAALGQPNGLVAGGKSLGGRMASLLATELEDERSPVRGVVCLGYPFHPPAKPDALRTDRLKTIRTPVLIAQGERDTFGNRTEIEGLVLSPAVRLHWLGDGDHDLKPRTASGRTLRQNWGEAVEAVAAFVAAL
jgi:predicted alpha/beta-hydrolase family hydrolase